MLRGELLALSLLAIGTTAYAGDAAPTLVKVPCRNRQLVSLVEYFTAKTVGSQLHAQANAQLSRFAQVKQTCMARVDIDYAGNGDVGWVQYSLPKHDPYAVYVSYRFVRMPDGYSLPIDTKPQMLDSTLLAEMQTAQPKANPPAKSDDVNVPIVEFEVLREARQRLLAAGWRPKVTSDWTGEPGSEASFAAAGYPEVSSCAADWGYCELVYVNAKGTCLSVISGGEEPKGAFVNTWRFGCE